MTCASCAVNVESTLKKQNGVENAIVNFADNSATITYNSTANLNSIQNAVVAAGYQIDISENISAEEIDAKRQLEFRKLRDNMILACIFTLPVFIFGMFLHHIIAGRWVSMALSGVVVFWFGRQFFVHAAKQLLNLNTNMDTLVALSTGVSFLFSVFNTIFPQILLRKGLQPDVYFESAAVITTFILFGKYLEEKAKSNTSEAIKMLLGLQAKNVVAIRNDQEVSIKTEEILLHDSLMIKPGEKIPADGIVTNGHSFVDESMISGEPNPQEKKVSDKVFAGTINTTGNLIIQAVKIGQDTVLGQIIKTVREAQSGKAPVQKMVDKIAGIFVPVVIGISIVTFIAWLLLGGQEYLLRGFVSAISVLVIACPCALGLATPTAIMVGVGKGAENGILIRNIEALENVRNIDLVLLDKTGTITKGKPEVTQLIWSKTADIERHAAVFSALEKQSEHPLAEAIVKALDVKESNVKVSDFKSITGKGVSAQMDGKHYYAGSENWMKEKLIWIEPDTQSKAMEFRSRGNTVFFLAENNELIALVAIADAVKESSAQAIETLKKKFELVMLTGDNKTTAASIAQQVGIQEYYADLLPADKAGFVVQQKEKGRIVVMVGDGINDSEALAKADISMAMGKGTDIAISVADFTLMRSDLSGISAAINLSASIVSTIRQNLFWAFIYNIIGIPLAAGILFPFTGFQLDPMIASAAMALSSVSVVTNSLLLKTKSI
ncbi:MAG: copper-translocating P-type ATPase [Chitinophagales bacterium]|nr:copper-translocating P-type ATPase [Chitinophagales bacterium]